MKKTDVLSIMLTYNTQLSSKSQEDISSLVKILEWNRLAFNEVSKDAFGLERLSIVLLHNKSYYRIRKMYPEIPSQVVIGAERECLAAYRSMRSNKKTPKGPCVKKRLSIRLDKRLFTKPSPEVIRITTSEGRKPFQIRMYGKLSALMGKFAHKDPSIFSRDGKVFISLCFDTEPVVKEAPKLALGVDLGIRVAAACSDGRIIIDKKFNKEKRRLRYLKRCLQSKGTKAAKRHLRSLKRRERNKNKNQTHLIANEILKTDASLISLENLKGLKAKKNRWQCKNPISQVPLFDLRRVLTYKAQNMGKTVAVVNPAYTSQTDSLTGKREGERRGRRFYCKNGLVLDADINAARNIGQRSKLPVSYGNILDGQAAVTRLTVGTQVLTSPRIYSGVL